MDGEGGHHVLRTLVSFLVVCDLEGGGLYGVGIVGHAVGSVGVDHGAGGGVGVCVWVWAGL